MKLNSYLEKLAEHAIIRGEEKDKIKVSIASLKSRLDESLGDSIKEQFIFGSYSRDTILPRHVDKNSDVDYLVVFKNGDYSPQTYLNWLRTFVEDKYSFSEIFQSNPTIVLSLNHIHIELVPAITSIFSFKIPGKSSNYSSWIDTDPKELNNELIRVNKEHKNFIRKLIRIVKFWNVKNNYPFDSYELEQQICRHKFGLKTQLLGGQLKDYVFNFFTNFDVSCIKTKKGIEAVKRAKKILEEVELLDKEENQEKIASLLRFCDPNSNIKTSLDVVKKLFPPVPSLELELANKK